MVYRINGLKNKICYKMPRQKSKKRVKYDAPLRSNSSSDDSSSSHSSESSNYSSSDSSDDIDIINRMMLKSKSVDRKGKKEEKILSLKDKKEGNKEEKIHSRKGKRSSDRNEKKSRDRKKSHRKKKLRDKKGKKGDKIYDMIKRKAKRRRRKEKEIIEKDLLHLDVRENKKPIITPLNNIKQYNGYENFGIESLDLNVRSLRQRRELQEENESMKISVDMLIIVVFFLCVTILKLIYPKLNVNKILMIGVSLIGAKFMIGNGDIMNNLNMIMQEDPKKILPKTPISKIGNSRASTSNNNTPSTSQPLGPSGVESLLGELNNIVQNANNFDNNFKHYEKGLSSLFDRFMEE